ncbi:SDR family oxidoreductase [Galbibacter sp. BG1]
MYNNKYHNVVIENFSFLITGGAGFIGSNIVEYLLKYNAGKVVVLDDLSTGKLSNIEHFFKNKNFSFIEGDIRDIDTCNRALDGVDYVLHQAALGSVPRSLKDPITTNEINISGFLNMLMAVKESKVKRMVYAASSSTYGDSESLPKVEEEIGKPLSPYAVTKYVNEIYADVFSKSYDIELIGLRYFNVFGQRQDPNGAYAAVIPKFATSLINKEKVTINGDGEHSRDFTYIENVVQANIRSLFIEDKNAVNDVYNVAFGESVTLNELFDILKIELSVYDKDILNSEPIYGIERQGDVKHSLADISKAQKKIGYKPLYNLGEGIKDALKYYWYLLR